MPSNWNFHYRDVICHISDTVTHFGFTLMIINSTKKQNKIIKMVDFVMVELLIDQIKSFILIQFTWLMYNE